MNATSLVSQELESYGVRMFSTKEVTFDILGSTHPLVFSITQIKLIRVDLATIWTVSPTLLKSPPASDRASRRAAPVAPG